MDEPLSEDFKAFVGGISWHISDRELKDSELPPQPASCSSYQCWTVQSMLAALLLGLLSILLLFQQHP